MQFSLTDLQKEIKENAEKLLSEKIDPLQTCLLYTSDAADE